MKLFKSVDGVVWRLLFYQDYRKGVIAANKVENCNEEGRYSMLSSIETLRDPTISDYSFMLEYPDLKGRNIWHQPRSPYNIKYTEQVSATCINCSFKERFGALKKGCYPNYGFFTSDSKGNGLWWYTIGLINFKHMPEPVINGVETPVNEVYLYIQSSYIKRVSQQRCIIRNYAEYFIIIVMMDGK